MFKLKLHDHIFYRNSIIKCDVPTLLNEELSYNIYNNSERKIWLNDIELSNNKFFHMNELINNMFL